MVMSLQKASAHLLHLGTVRGADPVERKPLLCYPIYAACLLYGKCAMLFGMLCSKRSMHTKYDSASAAIVIALMAFDPLQTCWAPSAIE